MLRERVSRLANFRHAYYSRVRRVDRLDNGSTLGIVSETPHGARLSRILEVASACQIDLDVNAALCLVRQLVPAIAMLHQNARDVSHGALAPERIIVTSNARVVIVEYVLGAAIEQLAYSRERLWRDLRIAVPSGAGRRASEPSRRRDADRHGRARPGSRPAARRRRPEVAAVAAGIGDGELGTWRPRADLGAAAPLAVARPAARLAQLVRVGPRSAACAGRCAVGRGRLHRRADRARVLPGALRGMRRPGPRYSAAPRRAGRTAIAPVDRSRTSHALHRRTRPAGRAASHQVAPVQQPTLRSHPSQTPTLGRAAEVRVIRSRGVARGGAARGLQAAEQPSPSREPASHPSGGWRRSALAVVARHRNRHHRLVVRWRPQSPRLPGTVVVESKPSGAQVKIDGQDKGIDAAVDEGARQGRM